MMMMTGSLGLTRDGKKAVLDLAKLLSNGRSVYWPEFLFYFILFYFLIIFWQLDRSFFFGTTD